MICVGGVASMHRELNYVMWNYVMWNSQVANFIVGVAIMVTMSHLKSFRNQFATHPA